MSRAGLLGRCVLAVGTLCLLSCHPDPPDGRESGDCGGGQETVAPMLAASGYEYIDKALRALQAAVRELGSRESVILDADRASEVLRNTDVFLICDWHDKDRIKPYATWLLAELRKLQNEGTVAFGIEAIPATCQALLDAVVSAHVSSCDLGTLLSYSWPWPVKALEKELVKSRAEGAEVLGVGGGSPWSIDDGAATDCDRRPRGSAWDTLAEAEASFSSTNAIATSAIAAWIRGASAGKRKAVILFGTAHLLGSEDAILERLRKKGVRAQVVVSGVTEVEVALVAKYGDDVVSRWCKLGPFLVRPPRRS